MFSKHTLRAATDSLVFSLSGRTHWQFQVNPSLGSATDVQFGFDVSMDGGSTWTSLTEALSDTMLGSESITETVTLSADGVESYSFVRPGLFGTVGSDFAEALELMFATHVRMLMSAITDDDDVTVVEVKFLAFSNTMNWR